MKKSKGVASALLLSLLFYGHVKNSLTACYMHFLLSTICKIFSQNADFFSTAFLHKSTGNPFTVLLQSSRRFIPTPEHQYPAFRSTIKLYEIIKVSHKLSAKNTAPKE